MLKSYFDTKSPGSFGGIEGLYRLLGKKKSREQIKEWLSGQDAYTLHKPVIRKFKRNRVIVNGIDDQFQMDLADMSNLSKYNKKVTFLLTCIDVFSKYAWAIPLKNKSGLVVKDALEEIIKERKPNKIQSDSGKEFLNHHVQNMLKEYNIKFFVANNPEIKCSLVERFNRTLKNKIYRYLTYTQSFKYIDELQNLVTSYNNSYHRSIKMAPVQVEHGNEKEVWNILFGDTVNVIPKGYKFQIGDIVRISKNSSAFRRGYKSGWTKHLFEVIERHQRDPPVYKVRALEGEDKDVDGIFYEKELQKVNINTTLDPKIKKKKRKRRKRY